MIQFRSINSRFLVVSLVLVALVFGGLGLFIGVQNVRAIRAALDSKGKAVAELVQYVGADYMTNFNYVALDDLVEDVLKDQDVAFIAFYNEQKKLVTKVPEPPDTSSLIVLEHELKDSESRLLGSVRIGYKTASVDKSIRTNVLLVTSGILIATALLAAGIVLLIRSITRPLAKTVDFVKQVATGDFTKSLEVRSGDEIGELGSAVNKMIIDLKVLIGSIRQTASKTAASAEQIAASSREVKGGATTTSQASEETLASMEEMAASMRSVSENAESLSATVEQTSGSVTETMASIENVARNMTDLSSSVTETSSTVEEMTVSIEHVAKEAEDLTAVVHNAAASVEQMTKSIEQVDKHVQDAGSVSQRSVEEAKAGGEALSMSFKGMKNISATMDGIAALIQNLGNSSREIDKILAVIDEIADQTNLLALNAAIQAAQAGDAGRGFAVVATEVRELADRSRAAAKEIGEVIKRIQEETQGAVKSTENGARESAAAMEMADRAAEALTKIIQGVEKTDQIMNMIMKATAEQRTGSREVLDYVTTMRGSSDQMKRAMSEQAAGGRQIRLSVESMNRIMQEVEKATREQAAGSKQITVAVENMNQMTQKVSKAMAEQKQGGNHVVRATENISAIAKQNLDAVKQMAESSEDLMAEARILLKNVESFKL